jgi:hypothetical protein
MSRSVKNQVKTHECRRRGSELNALRSFSFIILLGLVAILHKIHARSTQSVFDAFEVSEGEQLLIRIEMSACGFHIHRTLVHHAAGYGIMERSVMVPCCLESAEIVVTILCPKYIDLLLVLVAVYGDHCVDGMQRIGEVALDCAGRLAEHMWWVGSVGVVPVINIPTFLSQNRFFWLSHVIHGLFLVIYFGQKLEV